MEFKRQHLQCYNVLHLFKGEICSFREEIGIRERSSSTDLKKKNIFKWQNKLNKLN